MFKRQLLRQQRALTQSIARSAQIQRTPFSSISSNAPRVTPAAQSTIARRWQSDDSSKKGDGASKKTDGAASEAKPAEANGEDATTKELEAKNKEIKDLKDLYLRSVADYRNLENRTKRDMDSARQFAIQRFATDLLDSIDNLDRAMTSVPAGALGNASNSSGTSSNTPDADPNKTASSESASPNPDLVNLHSGLKMTEEILMGTLEKHGLERFDPLEGKGRKFDPNKDEATFFMKQEGKEDGDVFFTQSKGFTLNGRVIRAAKVGVVKNS